MKSIMTKISDYCYICGRPAQHVHHVFYGTANRRLSEKYGLKVPLCEACHTGPRGVHFNRELDLQLKRMGQATFKRVYPHEDFVEIFGRHYLQ